MQIHTQSEQKLAVIFMETPLAAPPGALHPGQHARAAFRRRQRVGADQGPERT